MIGHSPGKYRLDFTFKPELEPSRRLQKSHTRTEGIHRTPSTQYIKSCYDLQHKPTDKKKSSYNVAYQAPVLIQQNKTLLAQNREMALLIHERNLQIEALQRKYEDKIEGEEQLFRQIEAQKQRFVGEVIKHKEQTDLQIATLEQRLRQLEEEKVSMERKLNRQRTSQLQLTEINWNKQIQSLKSHYQQNLTTLQSEKMKLKSELEQRSNQIHILEMEGKQKTQELQYEVQKAKEQAKHSEHLRKLQKAELKHYYENKLQKIHLDHRRDKQLFLTEHENQISKLKEEVSKLKNQDLFNKQKLKNRQLQVRAAIQQQAEVKQRLVKQAQQARILAKQQLSRDKITMNSLFMAETQAISSFNNEELNSLLIQNSHLSALLSTKTEEIARLYSEFDALRDRYCLDLQKNEKIISDLVSQMYTNQLGNEEEKEVLKTKLAVLRQSDLNGLKKYYQNQIISLNGRLADKDSAILQSRAKLHEELKNKEEMRKKYQIELANNKSRIIELQTTIRALQEELHSEKQAKIVKLQLSESKDSKQTRSREKNQQMKQDELQHLQGIIAAKDKEIQELEKKIHWLKANQVAELDLKQAQLQGQRNQYSAALSQKSKSISRLESEIVKLKEIIKREADEHRKKLEQIDTKRKLDLESASEQTFTAKNQHEQEIARLKGEIRRLTLQVAALKAEIQSKQQQAQRYQQQIQDTHVANNNREKEMLEEFYLSQIRLKDEEITDLRQRNSELSSDIMDARQNYASLQKKLQSLIESHGTLRQLENKVMNLGKENNLVKNKKQIYG